MWKCNYCGKENEDSAKFCNRCRLNHYGTEELRSVGEIKTGTQRKEDIKKDNKGNNQVAVHSTKERIARKDLGYARVGKVLTSIGLVLFIVALFWWGSFYAPIMEFFDRELSDALSCLYSSAGLCANVYLGAQLVGKTPYPPGIFWIAVASIVLGFLLRCSSTSPYNSSKSAAETSGLPSASSEQKCPFCAETIKAEAKVCRYCQRDLPTSELKKGECPNCGTILPVDAKECTNAKCAIKFGPNSVWRIHSG